MMLTKLRIGVVFISRDDGMASLMVDGLRDLGHEVIGFAWNGPIPGEIDAVLAWGFHRSLVPLANQLLEYPSDKRPIFVLWQTEQLPRPDIPDFIKNVLGSWRTGIERLLWYKQTCGQWTVRFGLDWLTKKAVRFRYYGDLHWFRRAGILSILVLSSKWTATLLRSKGFYPIVVPLGSRIGMDWGMDLQLTRDVPVLWLGTIATRRRRRLLMSLRSDLRKRGIDLLVVDGEENPKVYGEARTYLLNRAKIAVNLLREEWDDNQQRYYLAAACKSMIVSEPTLPHSPFVPGMHLVEVPVEHMADTVCYYLSHEDERQRIAEAAYRLVIEDLTLEKALTQICMKVADLRRNKQNATSA
jgi:hypothetical protein